SVSVTITADLTSFERNWGTLKFDLHERQGYLPVAEALTTMRQTAGVSKPVAWQDLQRIEMPAIPRRSVRRSIQMPRRRSRVVRSARAVPPKQPEPRFLNASFWQEDSLGQLERLAATACVLRGRVYQLGAQLGPHDSLLVTIGATAILEEVFKF